MKRLLMLCALLVTGVPQNGMADVISVYSDCTGASCSLAPGFTSTAAVMHKFTTGAVASRFKISFPPGSSFFSFATSFVPVGNVETGIQVGYGQCLNGSFCIGNLVAILAPGPICIYPAVGPTVTYTDCSLVEYPAFASWANVGGECGAFGESPCTPLAVESSTWGQVKALYR
jgi:hypothetical protein